MLMHLPAVLPPPALAHMVARLESAGEAWVDGRATAGHQGAAVKHNQQLAEDSAVARELGDLVLAALERHPRFISAALPHRVYPPMFNRHGAGMRFGNHVDGAVRHLPGSGDKLRTDLSATLFLADPATYDGGALVIVEPGGGERVARLAAGDLLLYPSTHVHRVEAVTRGVRLAAVLWVQSLVRDGAQRALLHDLDLSIQRLAATDGDEAARVALTGTYHNLLRMWADA